MPTKLQYLHWNSLVNQGQYSDLGKELHEQVDSDEAEMVMFKMCFDSLPPKEEKTSMMCMLKTIIDSGSSFTDKEMWRFLSDNSNASGILNEEVAAFLTGAGLFFMSRYELDVVAGITAFLIRETKRNTELLQTISDFTEFLELQRTSEGVGIVDPFEVVEGVEVYQRQERFARYTFICNLLFNSQHFKVAMRKNN